MTIKYYFESQVVYATLETPIKHWSSDMLNKLEADMFDKAFGGDAAGDDIDSFEEIYDECNM